MTHSEIVIIGGGLAGAVSALRARELGREVLLVRKAWGATAMSSGAFDVAGDILRIPGREWEDCLDIIKNIGEIQRRSPRHPYALVGKGIPSVLKSSGERLPGLFLDQGIEMNGSWEKNGLFPTILGTMRATALCQGSLAGGNLLEMKGAHVLCVGISRLSDFNVRFLSRSLYEKLKGTPLEWHSAESAELGVKGWSGSPERPSEELTSQAAARALDDPDISNSFIGGVERKADGKGYTHILLPPVMGLFRWKENISALEKATGASCAEVFPLSPSVPGMRFQIAIDTLLIKAGIKVIQGIVTGYNRSNGRVTGVEVKGGGAEKSLDAKAYVLASGRFIGGGVTSQGHRTEEEIFSLPVIPGEPSMSSGVRVDPDMRPCDEYGGAVLQNLFCAGSVIGGYDPAREMCGSGVALLTGSLAGENAGRSAG